MRVNDRVQVKIETSRGACWCECVITGVHKGAYDCVCANGIGIRVTEDKIKEL